MSAIIKLRLVRGIMAKAIKLQDPNAYYNHWQYPASGWYVTGPWIVAVRKDEQDNMKSTVFAFPADLFENAELEPKLEEQRPLDQTRPAYYRADEGAVLQPGENRPGDVTQKQLLHGLLKIAEMALRK